MPNFQFSTASVRGPPNAGCIATARENLKQGLVQIEPTLLFGISNFPLRLQGDAHGLPGPLPHVASDPAAGRRVHWKAGTAGAAGWDLLLEAHSGNLRFQCPSSISSRCFWLLKRCQLSCIPRFCVNIFTFVTPNWLNATQAF